MRVRDYARKSTLATAAIVDAAAASALKVALGRRILMVESIDFDRNGVPVITMHSRFRQIG